MTKKVFSGKHIFVPGLILGMGLLFCSCTGFFSTSLAPWAARDPDKLIPNVTPGNVKELLDAAENNPDMSLALLKKIKEAADTASGGEKAALQSSALEAAVNAAGLGSAVLNKAGAVASVKDPDDAKKLLTDAINDMKNLESAGSTLTSALPDPTDAAAFTAFTDAASPDDLAMAAALLLAGEAKTHPDIDDYIETGFNKGTPNTDAERLAVKMAEAAMDKYTTGTSPLKDLLNGLNLI
jgi:hypothetical protein